MATFTIVVKHPSGDITFTYTPYLEVSFRMLHRDTEPPTIVGVEETWSLTDLVFLGTPDEIQTSLSALEAKLVDRTNQITGLEFKKDGTKIDELSTTTHTKFKVTEFRRQKSGAHYQNHLVMTLTARGVLGIEDPAGGDSNDVTNLEITTTYDYSKEGFLRKTYAGRVETLGSSAVAKARLIGQLDLPSDLYTYANNGPEGLNVVQEDAADRKASWVCTIEEQGVAVPSAEIYQYEVSRTLDHTRYGYTMRTEFTIAASSLDIAEDTANELKPSRVSAGGYTKNENTNSVNGFWTEFVPSTGAYYVESFEHTISRTGGGHTITEIPIPGNDPALLQNAKSAVRFHEQMEVVYYGEIGNTFDRFLSPFINKPENLNGDPEETLALAEQGLSRAGNKYKRSRSWNWVFSSGIPALTQAVKAVEQTELGV